MEKAIVEIFYHIIELFGIKTRKELFNWGILMIIMINGAFGVGKTSVASRLIQQIDNSMLFDPEEVGLMLRNVIPKEIRCKGENTGDFQDFELWKELTVTVAGNLVNKYSVNLVVPMTIYRKEYFDYIYNGFKEIDRHIHHFCLSASLDTIHKRLEKRGDIKGSWPYQQTVKCIQSFKEYDFSEYIDTEVYTADEIVDTISKKVNLICSSKVNCRFIR